MLEEDAVEPARDLALTLQDRRVTQLWDPERKLGELVSRTLGLSETAWDAYILYPPGPVWEDGAPPRPAFWMHQLGSDSGADPSNRLDAAEFSNEVGRLLQEEIAASH
jgi:hypothetical protein